jgi:predicted Zn-dependent protease
MIPNGRLAEPANTIRISDNIATFLNNVIGVI